MASTPGVDFETLVTSRFLQLIRENSTPSENVLLPSYCLGTPDPVRNDTFSATGYSYGAAVALSVLTGVFCMYSLLGNIAVIVIICLDRIVKKQPQNQYLISLAAADALLAVFVVPFSLVNELYGIWPFGLTYCKIYLAADVLFCTASIWNICAIGLDRFWSVRRPLTNRRKRTKKAIRLIIIAVWSLSFFISVPPFIFGFKLIATHAEDNDSCNINDEEWYIVFSSVLSFFLPAAIIAPVYTQIYIIGRRHSRPNHVRKMMTSIERKLKDEDHQEASSVISSRQPENTDPDPSIHLSPNLDRPDVEYRLASCKTEPEEYAKTLDHEKRRFHSCLCLYSAGGKGRSSNGDYKGMKINYIAATNNEIESSVGKPTEKAHKDRITMPQPRKKRGASAASNFSMSVTSLFSHGKRRSSLADSAAMRRNLSLQKRERRFTLIICLVTGGFLFCWYPFFQTYVVYALCGKACCINKTAFKATFWLGYLNSGLNPTIYTIFNKEFRRAFRNFFTGCSFREKRKGNYVGCL